ncbi:hypothetical protein VTK73DRAFT_1809 [Phialemonium thermophilum]|uniref:PARP-type domain-containing protein n=1 Tax=Phialemonium thermophilum TaxID=223376 RepID=A0ABR3X8H7_9PEZI
MPYRIELAKSGRALCTDTVCKNAGEKIAKGELRLGTWVEMPGLDRGSWKWKHWGCVSGAVIQSIRDTVGLESGNVDWDAIDGYDELAEHPDVQEKIRRVVTQGHIDPEDFKGDPEMNHLGAKGIRSRKKATKGGDDAEAGDTPAKKSSGKKRGRKAADDSDEEKASPEPPRKKAAKGKGKASKLAKDEDEEEEVKEKKKAPQKHAAKAQGARRGKGRAQVEPDESDQDGDEAVEAEKPLSKRTGKAKPAAKVEADEDSHDPNPAAKKASAKSRKGRKGALASRSEDN